VRTSFGWACFLGFTSIVVVDRAGSQALAVAPLAVNVRVVDTAGLVVSGADVAIIRRINESVASGTTDGGGRATLTVTAPQGDYQLVVRKIGYNRSDQFFHATSGGMSFDVVMHRTVQALAPVTVTAQEDLKRKSYFIDADEIAKHADQLIDASDILKKLKPDMICGRSCSPLQVMAATTRTPARKCPSLVMQPRRSCPVDNTPPSLSTNVWVNGVFIRSVAPDTVCQMGRRGLLAGLSRGSMQVLCEIQPEHIEQMTYADEFDTSVGKNHSDSALFIVLKPGVGYLPGAPSYVVSDTPAVARRKKISAAATLGAPAPDSSPLRDSTIVRDSLAVLPAYRYRLLGVFDQDTGDVIEGARVTDVNTGDYMVTSPTGTVSLVFLPEGRSQLRITKAGYEDVNLPVDIGPAATTGITLLMKKKTDEE